jgi:DnaK suppressor protein
MRRRIEAELQELDAASTATAGARRPVELDQQSVGRLSRMDAIQNQAMAAGTETRRRARVAALVAAARRLDDGTYGLCEDCGDPIEEGRLDLDPAAARCVDCVRG